LKDEHHEFRTNLKHRTLLRNDAADNPQFYYLSHWTTRKSQRLTRFIFTRLGNVAQSDLKNINVCMH